MAKKRTRAQKMQAQTRYVYHYSADDSGTDEEKNRPATLQMKTWSKDNEVALLLPTGKVVGDLWRTVFLSLVVLGVEILLYWYWR